MAIKVFEYTVTTDAITNTRTHFVGTQGDKNVAELVFKLDAELITSLKENYEGGKFYYRFDGYDGAGGFSSTDPIEFDVDNVNSFSYSIENWQTKYGGTIQTFFVITYIKDETTELELYAYSVKMKLKSKPDATFVDGESLESITTLAVIAKSNAETAVVSAEVAKEAQDKTENARAALENGTVWVFDGGDASGKADLDGDGTPETPIADIKFVIDGEMSDTSENAVKNKIAKAYIDRLVETAISNATSEIKKSAKLDAHPIGSLYFSSEATEPSELFGGTWERVKDKFILAAGDSYFAGESDGEAEVTLTEEQMPSHRHAVSLSDNGTLYQGSLNWINSETARLYSGADLAQSAGGDQPHNNMPPYEVYYCWKRTA